LLDKLYLAIFYYQLNTTWVFTAELVGYGHLPMPVCWQEAASVPGKIDNPFSRGEGE
jgi:hypothetical protein